MPRDWRDLSPKEYEAEVKKELRPQNAADANQIHASAREVLVEQLNPCA